MKKNIAIHITELTEGGAERIASYLSCYLPEDYNKYIVLYDLENISYTYKGTLIDLGKTEKKFFMKIIVFIKRLIKLHRFKKNEKVDLTISFLDLPNISNVLTKRTDKVIISVRNFKSIELNNNIGKFIIKPLIKATFNRADKIVAISEGVKEDLIRNFNINSKKVVVIYNPCDFDNINELKSEPIEDKYKEVFNKPVIITAGRLVHQKGQWHLIRAFKKVKEEFEDAKLVILGHGKLEDYLKKIAKELNLEDDIIFLGFKDNPYKYIANSKVFVFPSLFEGFGNVITEAMACGVPIVSSDCNAGPREILDPKNNENGYQARGIEYGEYGVLVPPCDGIYYDAKQELTLEENFLYRGMVTLLKDEKIRNNYREKSEERVKDFKMDNIIEKWVSIF